MVVEKHRRGEAADHPAAAAAAWHCRLIVKQKIGFVTGHCLTVEHESLGPHAGGCAAFGVLFMKFLALQVFDRFWGHVYVKTTCRLLAQGFTEHNGRDYKDDEEARW